MHLEGLHHITMITGDAQRNVAFYADTLGLRLVKKTVNFDSPDAYHLYFGDEHGAPGSILTWFEFAGAPRGRAGRGRHPHAPARRRRPRPRSTSGPSASPPGTRRARGAARCASPTRTGSRSSSWSPTTATRRCAPSTRDPRRARDPASRAPAPTRVRPGATERCYDDARASPPPATASTGSTARAPLPLGLRPGAGAPAARAPGSVHHIAWALAGRRPPRLAGACRAPPAVRHRGARPRLLPLDLLPRAARVLFEIATLSPGFAVDEDPEHLGEELRLPAAARAPARAARATLTPVVNPRAAPRGSRMSR